jgi:hypothetical protein
VIAALAIAGAVALGSVAGAAPASAQGYAACSPGYYYSYGYCYPYSYYAPYGYGAPFLDPSIGLGFGFGGGFHHFDHDDFHGGGFHGGGFHGGGHR